MDMHMARARPSNGCIQRSHGGWGGAAPPSPSAGSPRPHRRLLGGRPSRHPPASEMKKNDNIKIETARSHAYHELTGCLEAE